MLPAQPSLFIARLTPYLEADLAITARMPEAPPAGAEWAVELSIANHGPADAGVTNVAYTIPYLGAGYSVSSDRGTCTLTPTSGGGSLVGCTMTDPPARPPQSC